MDDEKGIIAILFARAYEKCFGKKMADSLTESESKYFSNEIYAATGLTLGWKSLKNYSQAVVSGSDWLTTPSVASLDTISRYLEDAPSTTELSRKKAESHYPYWFSFKEKNNLQVDPGPKTVVHQKTNRKGWRKIRVVILPLVLVSVLYIYLRNRPKEDFTEEFRNSTAIQKSGWKIWNPDAGVKGEKMLGLNGLVLYTLQGDNFDSSSTNTIRNILVKEIRANSFSVELHFADFYPKENWQQCGILLMEDSLINSRCIRFSLGYNDFFGGYQKPGEVILQALASASSAIGKPELLNQTALFQVSAEQDNLIRKNLKHIGLRIEKAGENYRFLYATGENELFAFTELKSKEIRIQPKFVGVYASSGNRLAKVIPVKIERVIFKTDK